LCQKRGWLLQGCYGLL
nr:immunoglobulin heavy chain junction region [Mus musculus]